MTKSLTAIFLCSCALAFGQSQPVDYQPYFSAVIVKNLTVSQKWYQSVFDLKIKSEMKDPNQTYNITILESSNFMLELLELKGSIDKADFLKDRHGAEMQGHFKIGFKVSSAASTIKKLKELNIEVPNVWTDQGTGKKNFLVSDPDGNLIQFFE